MNYLFSLLNFIRSKPIISGLIFTFLIWGSFFIFSGEDANNQTNTKQPAEVEVARLDSFTSAEISLQTVGILESSSQAELRSQISAPAEFVAASIGDFVSAGQLLIRLNNDVLVAELSQAEAALSAQTARLSEIEGGARDEELSLSKTALSNAYDNTPNVIRSAGASMEDTLYKYLDGIFLYGDVNPQLSFNLSSQFIDPTTLTNQVRSGRLDMKINLDNQRSDINNLVTDSPDLDQIIASTKTRLVAYDSFLSNLLKAVESSIGLSDTEVSSYKANINLARNSISTNLDKVTANQQAITSAKENLKLIEAGATTDTIDFQKAQVRQAKAQVSAIKSRLNQTYITSPISGYVVSLPVRAGEFVGAGSPVASIVNRNGLQVKVYLNSGEAQLITTGLKALVEGKFSAIVAKVAPGLDSTTRKVEVQVALADPSANKNLLVGQFANVEIYIPISSDNPNVFLLPLSAVEITPLGAFIYTAENNQAVRYAVGTGKVRGESIEVIIDNLNPETLILLSVRGLKSGQSLKIITDR